MLNILSHIVPTDYADLIDHTIEFISKIIYIFRLVRVVIAEMLEEVEKVRYEFL